MVKDSIVIKGGSMLLGENSILKTFSFTGCLGRPTGLNLGGGVNNSIDHGASDHSENDLTGPRGQKVEKLLEYLFNTQIKALTICESQNDQPYLLSLGFKDGKI